MDRDIDYQAEQLLLGDAGPYMVTLFIWTPPIHTLSN